MEEMDVLAERVVRYAATNLHHARRHAIWLERIAAMELALALLAAGIILVAGPLAIAPAVAAALGGACIWGVLRGLALLLHLRVDDTMVALSEGAEATPPVPSR